MVHGEGKGRRSPFTVRRSPFGEQGNFGPLYSGGGKRDASLSSLNAERRTVNAERSSPYFPKGAISIGIRTAWSTSSGVRSTIVFVRIAPVVIASEMAAAVALSGPSEIT
jgi:hypothetical protein